MNVQNLETKDENKVETEQGEKPDLAMEAARKIADEDIDFNFSDIKDEALEKEIHERFTIEREDIPELPKEEKKEEPEQKVAELEVKDSEEEKPSQEYLQQRKEDLDELNTINQKIISGKKELERVNDLKTDIKQTKYDDPLSEESIQSINDRVNDIEKKAQTFYTDKSEDLQKVTEGLKQDQLYLQLQVFQSDNGLRMSKPLKTVDTLYQKFLNEVGGVEEASNFFKNQKFREQKESEGVSFSISEDDFSKYKTLTAVNKFKNEGKYPTFNSAYADYSEENGIVQDKIKQAVLNATTETVDKMTTQSNTATTLSPEDGRGSTVDSGDMSREDMSIYLMNMPENPTIEQETKAKLIHAKLFPTA